jgi:hypothetical protein
MAEQLQLNNNIAPFVKSCILSNNMNRFGYSEIFLDTTANLGFSGSPVYAKKLVKKESGSSLETRFIGVICSSEKESLPIYFENSPKPTKDWSAYQHAGFCVAHEINPIIDA